MLESKCWLIETASSSQLTLADETHTIIARYNRGSLGILPRSQSQLSWLEISPEGKDIIDEIIVTFIYYEDAETM